VVREDLVEHPAQWRGELEPIVDRGSGVPRQLGEIDLSPVLRGTHGRSQ
jgi:hypothetical protein